MRTLSLRGGASLPVLGLGTWGLGEDPARRAAEVRIVRAALEAYGLPANLADPVGLHVNRPQLSTTASGMLSIMGRRSVFVLSAYYRKLVQLRRDGVGKRRDQPREIGGSTRRERRDAVLRAQRYRRPNAGKFIGHAHHAHPRGAAQLLHHVEAGGGGAEAQYGEPGPGRHQGRAGPRLRLCPRRRRPRPTRAT